MLMVSSTDGSSLVPFVTNPVPQSAPESPFRFHVVLDLNAPRRSQSRVPGLLAIGTSCAHPNGHTETAAPVSITRSINLEIVSRYHENTVVHPNPAASCCWCHLGRACCGPLRVPVRLRSRTGPSWSCLPQLPDNPASCVLCDRRHSIQPLQGSQRLPRLGELQQEGRRHDRQDFHKLFHPLRITVHKTLQDSVW